MELSDLGALGEIISAIVVLISLIYISLQVRQTRQAAQSQAIQARTDTAISIASIIIQSDGLVSIFSKLESAGFPENGLLANAST